MKAHIIILAAVSDEIAGIKQRMKIQKRHVWGRVTVLEGEWQGYGVVLVRTGIGRGRALEALKSTLEQFTAVLVISTGYAGGLDPDLKVGDLVLADRVLYSGPASGAETDTGSFPVMGLDTALVNQAMMISCPSGATLQQGGLVTVDDAVRLPEEKIQLGKRWEAVAVDMETFALAEWARQENVPFLSLRAISDSAEQELADLSHLIKETGETDFVKAGWHVLTHPGDLKSAMSLSKQTRQATENLTQFLGDYLKNLR